MKHQHSHYPLSHLAKDIMALVALGAFSYATLIWLSFLSTLGN